MPQLTVAIPIHRATPPFERACDAILRQTLTDLDILFILNGADDATRTRTQAITFADTRCRIIELPEPNLAAALNAALESTRTPLLARMDADDWCPPHRLERQLAAFEAQPHLAALGCAWETADDTGRVIATIRPPTDPREMRWRLLLGNPLAHGSMMLRCEAVRAVGGYDTMCIRAQDYDLWLRLIAHHDVATLPDVLYRHHTRHPRAPTSSTPDQADAVAPRLLRAWADLPHAPDLAPIERALHDTLTQSFDPRTTREAIERTLTEHGPSREGLLALLWSHHVSPPAPRAAYDAARRARLREVGHILRATAVPHVWLWGAGDHTRWLLEHAHDLAVPIAGIIDDACPGQQRFGTIIQPSTILRSGDTALLSSDWHEEALWLAAAPSRARGVNIIRFYA